MGPQEEKAYGFQQMLRRTCVSKGSRYKTSVEKVVAFVWQYGAWITRGFYLIPQMKEFVGALVSTPLFQPDAQMLNINKLSTF